MALLGETADRDLASGRIYFKPAHHLRIEQEEPRPESVVSDGETLWWYLPHKKQVYRYPSQKLGQEIRLLGDILQGLKAVEERFDVRVEEDDSEGNHRLRLTPNPAWEQLDHINLFVAPEEFCIRMVEIYNILGSVTRFTLGEISVREAFTEDFFRFVPPKGVRVIEEE
jgi:outer membrane lipoprotein carrier protein